MISDTFTDSLLLVPPGAVPDGQGGFVAQLGTTNPNTIALRGRIEEKRGGGRRLVADQGDVPIGTHTGYLPPMFRPPDGSPARELLVVIDWHVFDEMTSTDYIVVAPVRRARDRYGNVSHLECDLQTVGGGV